MKKVVLLTAVALGFILIFATASSYAYTTNTNIKEYGVENNGTFTSATSEQTAALNAMRQRAMYEWSLNSGYNYCYKTSSSEDPVQLTLTAGNYRGILYQQKAYNKNAPLAGSREHWHSTATQNLNAINYMINNNLSYVRGTDCSSSVCYAWRTAINGNDKTSGILMSTAGRDGDEYTTAYTCEKIIRDGNSASASTSGGYGNYVTRVGQYGQAATNLSANTYNMLKRLKADGNFTNNATVYKRVYSKMQAGDILVSRRSSGPTHARLIEKVVIVKDEDGEIDPDNSHVVVTEQTSSVKSCTNTGLNETYYTTWYVKYSGGNSDKYFYSFKYLAGDISDNKQYYLPYRYNGNVTSSVLGFIVEPVTTTSVDVSWHAFDDEFCDGYELEYADNENFNNAERILLEDADECSETLENLKNNGTYYIRIRSYLYDDDGRREYSGYNNWVMVDLETGELDRENAPDPEEVSAKEYKEYIYNDISYDNDVDRTAN